MRIPSGGFCMMAEIGKTKMIIQDDDKYKQMQQTMALLKILALGNKQIEEGKVQPAADVFKRIRERVKVK